MPPTVTELSTAVAETSTTVQDLAPALDIDALFNSTGNDDAMGGSHMAAYL